LKRYDPSCRNRERCSPSLKLVLCRKNRVRLPFSEVDQVFNTYGTNLELSVNTQGRLITPEQFNQILLKHGDRGGRPT
jgi:hypothetical protein